MQIDTRLNDIDDCLYRVATKAIIVHDDKVLLVKEIPDTWWDFPGGGIDHGESTEAGLIRELQEELGIQPEHITTDFKIAYHTIGAVVNNIPRLNVYFRVNVPKESIKKTDHVSVWQWFTRDEFMKISMSPSYKDRSKMSIVAFKK